MLRYSANFCLFADTCLLPAMFTVKTKHKLTKIPAIRIIPEGHTKTHYCHVRNKCLIKDV